MATLSTEICALIIVIYASLLLLNYILWITPQGVQITQIHVSACLFIIRNSQMAIETLEMALTCAHKTLNMYENSKKIQYF